VNDPSRPWPPGLLGLLLVCPALAFWSGELGKHPQCHGRAPVGGGRESEPYGPSHLRWWESGPFSRSAISTSPLCFLAGLHAQPSCWWSLLALHRWCQAAARRWARLPRLAIRLPDRLQQAAPLVPALRSSLGWWCNVSVIHGELCRLCGRLAGSPWRLLFTDRDQALQLRSSSSAGGGFASAKAGPAAADLPAEQRGDRINEQLDQPQLSHDHLLAFCCVRWAGGGAVWANEAWGQLGGLATRKKPWALICWLVYAAICTTA